jgi:hypothetical protein
MIKAVFLALLFSGVFVAVFPAMAQVYSQAEKLKIADNARRLVRDRYFNNLEVLTHYEANQPVEVLQSQVNGLLKDAFLSRNVLVYNEFRGSANSYSTVEEYVKDCRIFTSGNPVSNTLAMKDARYEIGQNKDGFPFINLYVEKTAEGIGKSRKPFRFQNLVEFRIAFIFDKELNAFHSFKIAGISKVEKWPATAFTFTASDLEQAESAEKDLFLLLSSLTDQLKNALPTGSRQLVLEMFTYNRCGINNALSDRIFATLSSCLQNGFAVTVD